MITSELIEVIVVRKVVTEVTNDRAALKTGHKNPHSKMVHD